MHTLDLKIAVNMCDLTYTYQPILMNISHAILLCQHTTDCAEVCLCGVPGTKIQVNKRLRPSAPA